MAMEAFNLADEFQTPVFVMSDLDLGMNNWMADPFPYPKEPFRRGKVLTAEQLQKMKAFERYGDPDRDGVSYRTLPGTDHPLAAYFTRGSGHTSKATYSEKGADWTEILDKIARKISHARDKVPAPVVETMPGAKIGLIAYGSSHFPLLEARDGLKQKGLATDYLRIRGLPLNSQVENFLQKHDRIYCVEQNQQGQMTALLRLHLPVAAGKITSILYYSGMPLDAKAVVDQILAKEQR